MPDDVKEDVDNVKDDVKEDVDNVPDDVKEDVDNVPDDVKEIVDNVKDDVKENDEHNVENDETIVKEYDEHNGETIVKEDADNCEHNVENVETIVNEDVDNVTENVDNMEDNVNEDVENVEKIVKEDVDNVPEDVNEDVDNVPEDVNEDVDNGETIVKEDVDNDSQVILKIEPLFYKVPPKYIFIIPYRDRENEKNYFIKHMATILENYNSSSYRLLFVHQLDKRSFNRGAMKNIGFITAKMQFPNEYKNITLIFNDVDTMPKKKGILNYDTKIGTVKHFYGFRFSLGGIFSIKAIDFEKCNGFPNFFGYAYEDNLLYKRCQNNGIDIDRSNFFEIADTENIIQSNRSGPYRIIKKSEFDRFINNTPEGIYQIFRLKYTIEPINKTAGFINVQRFVTPYPDNIQENVLYDTRVTSQPFKPNKQQIRKSIQPYLKMKFI